jgi:hypothetical protein
MSWQSDWANRAKRESEQNLLASVVDPRVKLDDDRTAEHLLQEVRHSLLA